MLKGIDIKIEKGSLCIIIGEIGSGKSSLLNAMLGQMLYVPDSELEGPLFDSDCQADDAEVEKLVERLYSLEKPDTDRDHPIYINGQTSYVE